jgi:hypothetical protein
MRALHLGVHITKVAHDDPTWAIVPCTAAGK